MLPEPDTAVLSVEEQNWTMTRWSFGIAQSVRGIMNTVQTICLPMNISKNDSMGFRMVSNIQ
jgi:hypothetical protein